MQPINSLHPRFKEALEKFIASLSKNLKGDFEAYLFGSLARGDYLLDSDIDVMVVTKALGHIKPWERTAYLRKLAPENVGFDIICYTMEEFEEVRHLRRDLLKIT